MDFVRSIEEQSSCTHILFRFVSVPPKRTLVFPETEIAPVLEISLKLAEFALLRFFLEQNVDLEVAQAVGFR